LIAFLESALVLKVQSPLESRDLSIRTRRNRHAEMLTARYFEKLADLERRCAAELLKIHRHHLLKADADPASYPDHAIDLESEETWSKWGLGRTQLALAAAVAGGAAGLAIDVATGGLSHGLGAVAGAIGGGSTAWFKGGSLPDLRITLAGGVKLASGETRTLSIGPPRNPNFPWILLDGMLVRYRQILSRAHGRRDEQRLGSGMDSPGAPADAAAPGLSRSFPAARRDLLAKWFGSCLKGAPNRSLEPEVFDALVQTLSETG
jgi:hypothetical protein